MRTTTPPPPPPPHPYCGLKQLCRRPPIHVVDPQTDGPGGHKGPLTSPSSRISSSFCSRSTACDRNGPQTLVGEGCVSSVLPPMTSFRSQRNSAARVKQLPSRAAKVKLLPRSQLALPFCSWLQITAEHGPPSVRARFGGIAPCTSAGPSSATAGPGPGRCSRAAACVRARQAGGWRLSQQSPALSVGTVSVALAVGVCRVCVGCVCVCRTG